MADSALIARYFGMKPEDVDLLNDEDFLWYAAQARFLAEQEEERLMAAIAKVLSGMNS